MSVRYNSAHSGEDDVRDVDLAEEHNEALRARQRAARHRSVPEWKSDSSSVAGAIASARHAVASSTSATTVKHASSAGSIRAAAFSSPNLQPLVESVPLSTLLASNDEPERVSATSRRANSAESVRAVDTVERGNAAARASSATVYIAGDGCPPLSNGPILFLSERHTVIASPRRSPHHVAPLLGRTASSSLTSSPVPASTPERSPAGTPPSFSPPPPLHRLMRSSPPPGSLPPLQGHVQSGIHAGARGTARSFPPNLLSPKPLPADGDRDSAGKAVTLAQLNSLLQSKPDLASAACSADVLNLLRRFVAQNQDPSSSPFLQAKDDLAATVLAGGTSNAAAPIFQLLQLGSLAQRAPQIHLVALSTAKILTRKAEHRTNANLVTPMMVRALIRALDANSARQAETSSNPEASALRLPTQKEAANVLFNLCFERGNVSLLLECGGMRVLMDHLYEVFLERQAATHADLEELELGLTAAVIGVLHAICYEPLGAASFINYTQGEDDAELDSAGQDRGERMSAFDLTLGCVDFYLDKFHALCQASSSDIAPPVSLLQLLTRSAGLLHNLSSHPRAVRYIAEHSLGLSVSARLLQVSDDAAASAVGLMGNLCGHPLTRQWLYEHDKEDGEASLNVLRVLANCLFHPSAKAQASAVTALLRFCDSQRDRGPDAASREPKLTKYRRLLHAFLANSIVLGMLTHCVAHDEEEVGDLAVE